MRNDPEFEWNRAQEIKNLPSPLMRRFWRHLDDVIPAEAPFSGYETDWITQNTIVRYAYACLRGEDEAEKAASVLAGFDQRRTYTIQQALSDYNYSFRVFKGEMLIDYGGLDYFRPVATQESVCRDLSQLMSKAKDPKTYLALEKRLRELTTLQPAVFRH